MRKPFGPTTHGAIDYGFVAILALVPRLFVLTGSARTISYAFANFLLTDYDAPVSEG